MSTLTLPFAFKVGRGTGRASIVPFDVVFRVGRGSGKPSTMPFSIAFALQGLGLPKILTLGLSFAVQPPAPTGFISDGEDWVATAQRVWSGTGWVT
jgi:hypothetical protein